MLNIFKKKNTDSDAENTVDKLNTEEVNQVESASIENPDISVEDNKKNNSTESTDIKKHKGRKHKPFLPEIAMEKKLSEQIYQALQGDVVSKIFSKLSKSNSDAYWRSSMEGHSLKVTKEMLPDFYNLCHEVQDKLGFTDKVDFYITGDATVNAFSVAAEGEDEPHIVNINSALFDLMNTDELRFVIGHELGHLINKDTALQRLIMFVFPQTELIPLTLGYKIRLHSQLAELVADRYGFLAVENLDVCVTSFFKMASGLDLVKMNVSIDALIEDNTKRLEYFLKDKGISDATHPVNPIRVQALNLFANATSAKQLNEGIDELISILLKIGDGELDTYLAQFIATAGLIFSHGDNDFKEEELEEIITKLSGFIVFPLDYLTAISKQDVPKLFNESLNKILEINPGYREALIKYVISIVMSDSVIEDEELDMVYSFGNQVGFSEVEIATYLAQEIQQSFVPDILSIS